MTQVKGKRMERLNCEKCGHITFFNEELRHMTLVCSGCAAQYPAPARKVPLMANDEVQTGEFHD